MPAEGDQDFLDLYARELAYLRERGAEFSAAYPKVAARLGISGHHGSDPHVERLLESFAFLTARIQRNIEGDFPELTNALLGVLYPQYGSPVPAMAIANFAADQKLTSGHTIPKHTPLFAEASGGVACWFRTCAPVTLWPIQISAAAFVAPELLDIPTSLNGVAAALRIQIESGGPKLSELGIRSLRLFLNGSGITIARLYEYLFTRDPRALVSDGKSFLAEAQLTPGGFGPDEAALPYPTHAHQGYRLIQEYFAFPEKFFFVDIEISALPKSKSAEILILRDQRAPGNIAVSKDTFQLGCTPIINLYPKLTEPIRVDHRHPEYRLIGDVRKERTTEIHSIQQVTATAPGEGKPRIFEPFFSFTHRGEGDEPRAFWHARRVPTGRKDIPGTELLLSFVDLDFTPRKPPSEVVYAQVLCTNRDLAEEMSAGVRLQLDASAPVAGITCLTKPTPQMAAPLGGAALWRLISNLSLNHLSLSDSAGKTGIEALREILRTYLFTDSPQAERQILGMAEMSCRVITARVGGSAWKGFCRGTEVTLTLDEEQFVGSSAILFTHVMSRFLGLYANLNTFTQLVLKSSTREEEWKRCPPMVGEKALL